MNGNLYLFVVPITLPGSWTKMGCFAKNICYSRHNGFVDANPVSVDGKSRVRTPVGILRVKSGKIFNLLGYVELVYLSC